MMDKIAIFCSASENIEPVFFEKARELGVWMGQNKKTLVSVSYTHLTLPTTSRV